MHGIERRSQVRRLLTYRRIITSTKTSDEGKSGAFGSRESNVYARDCQKLGTSAANGIAMGKGPDNPARDEERERKRQVDRVKGSRRGMLDRSAIGEHPCSRSVFLRLSQRTRRRCRRRRRSRRQNVVVDTASG